MSNCYWLDIYLFSKHLNICKRVNLSYICKKSEVYRSHKFPLSAQGPSNFVTLNSFQNTGRGGFEECDRKVVKFLNVISLFNYNYTRSQCCKIISPNNVNYWSNISNMLCPVSTMMIQCTHWWPGPGHQFRTAGLERNKIPNEQKLADHGHMKILRPGFGFGSMLV